MCGVFGAVLPGGEPTEAAAIAALGLFALQHRGQESAGRGGQRRRAADALQGPRDDQPVLDERRLPSLRGELAIAHCRYSTTGSTIWENAQPTYRLGPRRALAIGHNGNLVNTRELLDAAARRPVAPARLDRHRAADRAARRRAGGGHGRGARPACCRASAAPISLVVLDERRVIGVRDPFGFRPLVLGRLPGRSRGPAARTTACGAATTRRPAGACRPRRPRLDIVGAEYVRDVEPGEMVVLEPGPGAALGPLRRGATPRCACSS